MEAKALETERALLTDAYFTDEAQFNVTVESQQSFESQDINLQQDYLVEEKTPQIKVTLITPGQPQEVQQLNQLEVMAD